MKKEWKREVMRDILALGSWVFYIVVLGRALIGPYRPFADYLVLSGLAIILATLAFRNFDGYVSRCTILIYFTSIFYGSLVYTLFVSAVGILLIFSAYFVERNIKKVIFGVIAGVIAAATGYYLGAFTIGLF